MGDVGSPPYIPPYVPISYCQVKRRTALLPPPNHPSSSLSLHIPRYRLNQLATDGDYLYVPISSSQIARYHINRACGITLVPQPPIRLVPPVTINNLRVANFPPENGGHVLLMTGGNGGSSDRGSVTVLPLLRHSQTSTSLAHTYYLPLQSTWGLAIHNKTAKFAVSSNSMGAIVLSLDNTRSPAPSRLSTILNTSHNPEQLHPPLQMIEQTNLIMEPHTHNIPAVHFSPCGNFLATASIDCSFAIYNISHNSVKLLSQSQDHQHYHSIEHRVERCWSVHWLHKDICVPVIDSDNVWQAWGQQRQLGNEWTPPPSYTYKPSNYRPNIFHPNPTEEPNSSQLFYPTVLYDDSHPIETVQSTRKINAVRRTPLEQRPGTSGYAPSGMTEEAISNAYASDSIDHERELQGPLVSVGTQNAQPFIASTPYPLAKRSMQDTREHKVDGSQLLLVCREETISLHRIDTQNLEATFENNTGKGSNLDGTEILDSLKIFLNKMYQLPHIYTNVIEIPQLNLIIVTSVNIGVILLRILRPAAESILDVADISLERATPCLFVEKIISPPGDYVIGTCVVERPGDNLATTSFELWITMQDAAVECWDLCLGDHAVDLSVRF